VKDAAIRAARTFAQTFIGVYLAGLVATNTTLESLADLTLIDQAVAAAIVAVLSFLQNWLEAGHVNYDRG
jgi:hypothetical protein